MTIYSADYDSINIDKLKTTRSSNTCKVHTFLLFFASASQGVEITSRFRFLLTRQRFPARAAPPRGLGLK